MSGLIHSVETDAHPGKGAPAKVLTTERWLAIYVLGSLGALYLARRAFREFIPR